LFFGHTGGGPHADDLKDHGQQSHHDQQTVDDILLHFVLPLSQLLIRLFI
jgi:hypothetical protein